MRFIAAAATIIVLTSGAIAGDSAAARFARQFSEHLLILSTAVERGDSNLIQSKLIGPNLDLVLLASEELKSKDCIELAKVFSYLTLLSIDAAERTESAENTVKREIQAYKASDLLEPCQVDLLRQDLDALIFKF